MSSAAAVEPTTATLRPSAKNGSARNQQLDTVCAQGPLAGRRVVEQWEIDELSHDRGACSGRCGHPCPRRTTAITGEVDPLRAAQMLRSRGPRLVAVTLARDGAVLLGDGEPMLCPGYAVEGIEPWCRRRLE